MLWEHGPKYFPPPKNSRRKSTLKHSRKKKVTHKSSSRKKGVVVLGRSKEPSTKVRVKKHKGKITSKSRSDAIGDLMSSVGMQAKKGARQLISNAASGLLTSVIGMGDYKDMETTEPIQSNTLLGVQTPDAAQVPIMHKDKGAVRISHREYICDIPMTSDFKCTTYTINPVNETLFPWLRYPAAAFSEWSMSGLIFEVKSLAANAISGDNAGMGSITASVNYDVYGDPPRTKAEANNAMYAVSCKPSESMMCPVECDPDDNPSKILRVGQAGTDSSDRHFYNMGNLNIVTQGANSPYPAVAELWATYDIWLYKPIMTGLGDPRQYHSSLSGVPAPCNYNTPFNLFSVTDTYTNTFQLSVANSGVITFPFTLTKGTLFGVIINYVGSPTVGVSLGAIFTPSGGLSAYNMFANSTGSARGTSSYATVSAFQANYIAFFRYDGSGTAIDPPRLTLATTSTNWIVPTPMLNVGGDLFVVEFPLSAFPTIPALVAPVDELSVLKAQMAKLLSTYESEHKSSVKCTCYNDHGAVLPFSTCLLHPVTK